MITALLRIQLQQHADDSDVVLVGGMPIPGDVTDFVVQACHKVFAGVLNGYEEP